MEIKRQRGRTGRRAVEPGPTSATVARNVRRLRERAGLKQADLADRLAAVGRPILATGISKIEKGERAVDVDDLVALALALEVNTNVLLLPAEPTLADAELTDATSVPWVRAWSWATGETPLPWAWGRREQDSHRPGASLSALAQWHETVRPHKDADEIAAEVAATRRRLVERYEALERGE